MDIYLEKLITQKENINTNIKKVMMFVGGILLIIISGAIPVLRGFFYFILLGVIFGIYYFITSLNIEYEYILTNDEIDIDKITAKKKRKRILSANCRHFEIIAKKSSTYFTEEIKRIPTKISVVSSNNSPDVYFFITIYKGKRVVVLFEPGEEILNVIYKIIPSKVHI